MANAVEEFFVSIPDTVRGLFRHDPSTRAASVEFWVVASTCLLLLKYAVGSVGPRMLSSRHVNPGVQLVRIFSHYSVAYSLGLMQPSTSVEGSASNDLFMVWAVLIVTMQDSVSIGRPYKPQEMSTIDLLTSLWSANQLRANTASYLKVPLWLIWSIHASRIIWYYVSSDGASGASADNMKLVGDYMASKQHAAVDACPATMVGYRYLVLGEDEQEMQVRTPSFKSELDRTRPKELITVERVWSRCDSGDKLLGRDSDDKFKDVCLSFALYKLLRRRFFDFPIPEAKDAAMRQLVSEAILVLDEKTKNYERAFRVTEVELSFLQDFSYSKHSVVFAAGFPTQRLMLSLLMTSAAMYLAYAVRELPPAIDALTSGDRLATITHGELVTRTIILILVCRELWEIGVFILSQWTKVVIMCHYIRLQQRPGWIPMLHRLMTEKVARIMFRVIQRGKWNENIQQHNLLMMAASVETTKTGPFRSRSVKLQSNVRRTIFDSLKKVLKEAQPEKGSPSSPQRRSSETLISHYKNAFADTNGSLRSSIEDMHVKLKGDTHKILVWHVATSLCQIKLLKEASSQGDLYTLETPEFTGDSNPELKAVWPDYITAVSLSNYCAYLATEALVPDNGLVVKTVLDKVRQEAIIDLARCGTLAKIHHKLMTPAPVPPRDDEEKGPSIVQMGAMLSTELMESCADREDLWKRLSRFWAGFLLHLSASTTAAKHRIHLQGNGELTTHLWALLSHAGFLGDTAHGQQLLDPVDLNAA